ncbi:flippase [Oscillatoriales cyanobacterium LEGE 11467]|uniref:Flippase n=1 Tax=Zarconia navalis LEGE 11467 TaxID=1828826 RepID=A0A928W1T7_9CYAN|nr:flippase [Zarconia navalis]MBE9042421.1 flippase [Zarconia navalis LEGE 11467]
MKKIFSRLDWSYFYAFLSESTLALTFFFYSITGRILGPEKYESFAAAAALGAILSLFIQFGLPVLLQREVAANPEEGSKLTLEFLVIEVLNSILVLIVLFPIAKILGFEGNGLIVCYVVVLAEVCRAAKMTLRGVFKGFGWFRSESIAVALERSLVYALACLVLFLTQNLIFVVATIAILRSIDIVALIYYLNGKVDIKSSIDVNKLRQSLVLAYPFAVSGILWILYYQVDIVMLKGMAPSGEAGFYSASYRIIEIFLALPRVVFQVIFTRFARCHAHSPEQLPEQVYKANRLFITLVLPVCLGAGFLQRTLVHLIFGDAFLPSIPSLAILIPSLGISMFGNLAYRFLQATGQEKSLPPLLLVTAVFNVILNAILIPHLGGVGAAYATLLSEAMLCFLGLIFMIRAGHTRVGKLTGIISLLSLTAAACPSLILSGISPIFGVALLAASIFGMAFVMRPNFFLGEAAAFNQE